MTRYRRYTEVQPMSHGKEEYRSYVDGVPVKISEKYKPPRKIILPMCCQNISQQGAANIEEYDFHLERSVLAKMSELRKIRADEEAKCVVSSENLNTKVEQSDSRSYPIPQPTFPSIPILMPISASIHPSEQTQPLFQSAPKQFFNISDFETDNSSPFDNMELKTINDMEILASVLSTTQLKNENPQSTYNNNVAFTTYKNGESSGYFPANGYHNTFSSQDYPQQTPYLPIYSKYSFSNPYPDRGEAAYGVNNSNALDYPDFVNDIGYAQPQPISSQKSNSKSVPDIMQELEKELKEKRRQDQVRARLTKTPPPGPLNAVTSVQDLNSKTIQNLKPEYQRLVKNISEMGFPMDRVIRTCQKFEGDDKKVIEFLLQVQRLEEQSFPGDLVEKALPLNKYDEDETAKHLKAVEVLLDLGFEQEMVHKVLIETDNDRDRALEKLIS